MAGWKGTPDPGIATPLLTWVTGTRPADFNIMTINHDGFEIKVEGSQITATPYVVTVTSGSISPDVENHLRKVMKRNIKISAEDANTAYAFTLVPTVNKVTGRATLACSFKLTNFVLHTNNTFADITIEVVSTGSTDAPQLAPSYTIDMSASANISTGYESVGDDFSAATITPVTGSTERSSATITNVPINGKTFFKAIVLPPSN